MKKLWELITGIKKILTTREQMSIREKTMIKYQQAAILGGWRV